ncbi:MAG: hypothetical protein IKB15_06015 [Alistipes sp.]|nr:hypothetical protein [Alistipes sp.]
MKKSSIILIVVQVLLLVAIGGLLYWNFSMIEENVSAEEQIEVRNTAVIEHSKKVKQVVELFREAKKDQGAARYPNSCEEIVEFAKNGFVVNKTDIYDTNNLGKFEEKKGYVDEVWGKYSKDTIWYEPSYRLLAARELEKNPEWSNTILDTVYVRDIVFNGYTDEQIDEICIIPYSDNKEYRIDVDEENGRFRCHAPYVDFLDTKEYSQQFWNFIEGKFNYYINNSEGDPDMLREMGNLGCYAVMTATKKDDKGNIIPKYIDPESHRPMDVYYFGVTFGSLEKATLDGNWEDQRAKK